ncbi:DUF1853 family protein [Neiella marina]|uniref:DUF1853 family protein n=1 Tax=Neiella holothuriorum TaxID=2870530 RepID=A0ABS7EHV3_9GAMM|nr:DUF1853 family protein [Neiella holothuriorum]MBW8191934.1 DUF1853 family protein [Neiella holothuriorum]
MKENNEIIRDLKALTTRIPILDQTLPHQVDSTWLTTFGQQIASTKIDWHEIAARVERPLSSRLGLYVEQLWLALIDVHPDYRLISHNTQVSAHGQTIGAFDFLLEHQSSQTIEHWELACKFYLAVVLPDIEQAIWLGPNLNDDWLSKRQKLLNRQIALGDQPASKALLTQLGINEIARKRILAQGLVFQQAPATLSEGVQNGCWYRYSDWQTIAASHDWQHQHKLNWLSPTSCDSNSIIDSPPRQPMFLAAQTARSANQDDGYIKCFVVPDDWPEKAQKKAAEMLASGCLM